MVQNGDEMEISEICHEPFDHVVIDNFISDIEAEQLSKEFPNYNSQIWSTYGYTYDSPIEKKRTIRDWKAFPPNTYQFFLKLCSKKMSNFIESLFNCKNEIFPDYGLHGAGWHTHKSGDHLNIHLDYSIHPFANLQRKYNLILYLTPNWNNSWGGSLEFWSHDFKNNKPNEKIKTINNIYKRAVIFDTTQNSWHGISEPINCPENIFRKSIAMYFLTNPDTSAEKRKRALYAPLDNQKYNPDILELIRRRCM